MLGVNDKTDILIEDESGKNIDGKNVTEILGLEKQLNKKNFQSVKHYEVDIDVYDDIYDSSYVMQTTVQGASEELGVYDKLNKDMFLSLYKYKPEIVKESSMHKSTLINNKLMKEVVKTEEFGSLRKNCKMDVFNAAIGTEVVGKQALDVVREWKIDVKNKLKERGIEDNPFDNLDSLAEMEEELDSLMEQSENAKQMLEEMMNSGAIETNPSGVNAINAVSDEIQDDIKAIEQAMEQYNQQIDDIIENHSDIIQDFATKMTGAFSIADEFMSEITEQINAWGFDEGTGCKIPYEEKKMALERIRQSKQLKDLTKLIGRFKETAINDQKRKSKDGATAVKSITVGNKIERVLPSEKMKMCNSSTKKDFMRRYAQKELMEYQLESNKSKSQGPIICLIDTSGSMEGSREKWSKAVALAMLEIASMQKRDYAAIMFDSRTHPAIIIEKNEISPSKVLDIAEIFLGGGTNFERPLDSALDLIKTSRFKKADIVLITDGDSSLSDSFLKRFNAVKEEKEFSVMSVLINCGYRVSDSTLKKFSDKIIPLSNMSQLSSSDSDVLHDIFSAV